MFADALNPSEFEQPTTAEEGPEEAPDPFDPRSLRLDARSMSADLGVRREIVTVPVRKPSKDEWLRVHPSEDFTLQTGVLELKAERETYLVARPLWPELVEEATFNSRTIFTAISRHGSLFLWPVRLPGMDGRIDPWNASAMEAAVMARDRWVRMTANMALGAYNITSATATIAEPVWPEITLRDLLSIGFKDRFINSMTHPVLQRLRGEI